MGYHPNYGLENEIRMNAVRASKILGVRQAAAVFRVSTSAIYKWRKRLVEV